MAIVMHEATVSFTAAECGKRFAEAYDEMQAEFLIAMQDEISSWKEDQSWAMQCRAMVEKIPDSRRIALSITLGTLVEHLQESDASEVAP